MKLAHYPSCDTTLPDTPKSFKDAVKCIKPSGGGGMMITTDNGDGTKTLTAFI